jgi:hypothetical protein
MTVNIVTALEILKKDGYIVHFMATLQKAYNF